MNSPFERFNAQIKRSIYNSNWKEKWRKKRDSVDLKEKSINHRSIRPHFCTLVNAFQRFTTVTKLNNSHVQILLHEIDSIFFVQNMFIGDASLILWKLCLCNVLFTEKDVRKPVKCNLRFIHSTPPIGLFELEISINSSIDYIPNVKNRFENRLLKQELSVRNPTNNRDGDGRKKLSKVPIHLFHMKYS